MYEQRIINGHSEIQHLHYSHSAQTARLGTLFHISFRTSPQLRVLRSISQSNLSSLDKLTKQKPF